MSGGCRSWCGRCGPGHRSASGLPPRAPRTRPPPWRQRGRDPASERRARPGPRRPPARYRLRAAQGAISATSQRGPPAVRLQRHGESREPDAAEPKGGGMPSAATEARRGQAEFASRARSREGATWRLSSRTRKGAAKAGGTFHRRRPRPQAPRPPSDHGAQRVQSCQAGVPRSPVRALGLALPRNPARRDQAPSASLARGSKPTRLVSLCFPTSKDKVLVQGPDSGCTDSSSDLV